MTVYVSAAVRVRYRSFQNSRFFAALRFSEIFSSRSKTVSTRLPSQDKKKMERLVQMCCKWRSTKILRDQLLIVLLIVIQVLRDVTPLQVVKSPINWQLLTSRKRITS